MKYLCRARPISLIARRKSIYRAQSASTQERERGNMAQVTMQQVKELRERTQAGLNDCKGALVESDGDMDKAVEIILKKGLAKSAKRAGAVATEGEVAARIAADAKSGVLIEVNIQTDFAARNADFKAFVEKVLDAAAAAESGAHLCANKILCALPGGTG